MAKVIAITDESGALLAVLRADPIDIGNGVTVQAVPGRSEKQRHHVVEVPESLLGKRGKELEELHHEVARRLPG